MKPEVLQLSPILIPQIRERLEQLFTVHRYYEQADKEAYVSQHAGNIRGVITGGHTGISQALMARLPNLEVIAVNGVGTDAVDLAYARDRGIQVTATIGALTEDVADLAIGLLIGLCRGSAPVTASFAPAVGPPAPRRWHRCHWPGRCRACAWASSAWAGSGGR